MTPEEAMEKVNALLDLHHLNRLQYTSLTSFAGPQYNSPCPRCKIMTGNGGENRLRVYPRNPVDGQGSRDHPFFLCRKCRRLDDPSKEWSGDLIELTRSALSCGMWKARQWLGLAPGGGEIKPKLLEPTASITPGAPCYEWQTEGSKFVNVMHDFLFSNKGEKALQAIVKGRGIPGDVMEEDKWGWQDDPELYIDGVAWGQEGRMRIPRGLVIPEYHRDRDGRIELWSIAVRRTKQDILEEEAGYTVEEIARGKKAQRYWLVRGSHKSLYGAESIRSDSLVVLGEGQINAVTVQYAGRGEFAFAATQGASSGQSDPRILGLWLARARGVLLMQDPDAAGQKSYEFWSKALADKCIDHRPLRGDVNDMLVEKGPDAVYKFLDRGRRKFEKIFGTVIVDMAIASQDSQQAALPDSDISENPPVEAEAFSAFSEPISVIQDQPVEEEAPITKISAVIHDELSTKCGKCGESVVMYDGEGVGYCQRHRPDKTEQMCDYNGCTGEVVHRNATGYGWCGVHFASCQLMELGETMRSGDSWTPFLPLDVEAGRGIISVGSWNESGENNAVWVKTRRCQIRGGEQSYFKFACSADPAQIWAAASEVRQISLKLKKRKVPKFYEHPCCRLDCFNDAAAEIRVFWDQYEEGKEKGKYKHPGWRGHVVYTQHYGALEFCGVCTDAAYLLELAEMRGYKAYKATPNEVEEGEDNWVDFCMNGDLYKVGAMFDKMKRECPEEWARVLDLIH